MKKTNKLSAVALITAFFMMFSVMFVNASASENLSPDVKVSKVTFSSMSVLEDGYDEELDSLDSLPADSIVYASVSVKNNADVRQSAILSLQLMKDGVMLDAALTKSSVAKKDSKIIEVSIKTPADVSGMELKASLWDGFDTMYPLTSDAYLNCSDASIAYVTVDGIPVSFPEGESEIDFAVPVTQTKAPVVKVTAKDSSTAVKVKNPTVFPGSAEIIMTEADGTEELYTINYTCSDSYVSSFEVLMEDDDRRNGSSSGEDRNDKADVITPDGSTLWNNIETGTNLYKVHPYHTSNISYVNPEYASCAIVKTDASFSYPYYGEKHRVVDAPWVSFVAERPVTVYLAEPYANGTVNSPIKINSKSTWLNGWTITGESETGVMVTGTISYHSTSLGYGDIEYGGFRTICKNFEAGETVTLYSMGSGDIPYIAIIQPQYESSLTLTVDGTPLKGFSEGVYDYTYEIPGDQNLKPVVEVEGTEEKVNIVPPDSFPGTTVVEIGDKTYRINYTCDYISDFNVLIANEDRKNGGASGEGRGDNVADGSSIIKSLKPGESQYVMYNFTSSVTEVSPEFAGCTYVKTDASFAWPYYGANHQATDKEWFSFVTARPIRVYLAEAYAKGSENAKLTINPSSEWLNDWVVLGESTTGVIFKGQTTYHTSYGEMEYGTCRTIYKDFEAGDTVTFYTMGRSHLPYVPVITSNYLSPIEIKIDGNPLKGFSEEVYEYRVNLPADQLAKPVVEVAGTDKPVTVTPPDSFPGKTIVEIGDETYEILYSLEAYVTDFTILADEDITSYGETVADCSTLENSLGTGYEVYHTRYATNTSYITEVKPEFEGSMYIRMDGRFGWPYGTANSTYHLTPDNDLLSFKALRPVRVYIAQGYYDKSGYGLLGMSDSSTWVNDWTLVQTDEWMFKVNNKAAYGDIQFGRGKLYYKDFEAGETVTLCVTGKGNVPYVPVIATDYIE